MSEQLTSREENYSQWYQDLVMKADLAEHSAVSAIGRELLYNVIGISGRVVVIGMASGTCIGRIVVVSVMTCRAVIGNSSMCSGEWVEVIVQGESGRCPTRSS